MGVDTQYTYDSVGNLVKTIENLNTTREGKTENVYDNLGRIINSTDAESGTAKYEYDRTWKCFRTDRPQRWKDRVHI